MGCAVRVPADGGSGRRRARPVPPPRPDHPKEKDDPITGGTERVMIASYVASPDEQAILGYLQAMARMGHWQGTRAG
jgi:hypothetical protein